MKYFRRESVVYTLALAFLALMSIGSYLIINSIVTQQQHMASVISVSSRQRMLSQRVALLSMQYAQARVQTERESTGAKLRESIDLMRRSHRDLVEGSLALGIDPPQHQELKDIYFGPPHFLNRQVPAFLDTADQVVAEREQNHRDKAVALASKVNGLANESLLTSMDAAVNQYAADSEAVFRRSEVRVLFVTAAMLTALATEALFIFLPMLRRMRGLVEMAHSDPLTGCLNRRSFMEASQRDFARSRRTGSPLSVIFFDIDRFKGINDAYGHAAGDAVISTLAECVKNTIRTTDMLGRMGGEEFVVLLPDTDSQSALMVAEKLRSTLERVPVIYENRSLHFTASFGVAQISQMDSDPFALIERADTLMYDAKHAGRNCVKCQIGAT